MNTPQKIIGKGKFSKVLEMVDSKGNKIAIKVIKPEDLNFVEIDLLTRIKSPYLVRSVSPIVKDTYYGEGLVLELKEKNLLRFDIRKISGGQVKRIIMSLLYGLECLHKKNFLHLDIKPGNCLYDNKNGVYTGYLSDFGFSMRCENSYQGIVKQNRIGTLKYFPYEILSEKSPYVYNDKSDVWSLGTTILIFLGFNINLKFIPEESTVLKIKRVKKFWDSIDINKEIENVVSMQNVSELDKIDLYELLKNMLEKEPVNRISTKDFNKLRFYNNNTLENSCYLEKGKEHLYIPYSSTNVLKGVQSLRNYFKSIYNTSSLEVYFLSMEIFIRVMSVAPMEITEQTLQIEIRNSFITAMKYYKQVKISRNQYIDLAKNGYKTIKYLDGKIAPNKVFYKANYVEDLILFDNIILTNYNLLSFYNFLDLDRVFDFFRQNYDYEKIDKEKIKNVSDFFDLPIPNKNTERKIENDRSVFSYNDNKIKSETMIVEESDSNIQRFRKVELSLRKEIISYLESMEDLYKYTDLFRKISETKDIYGIYKDFFKNKEIQIYDLFLNSIPGIEYYIIKESNLGELKIIGDENLSNVIFVSEENNISLLVIDKETTTCTHYYSKYNENLEKYFKKYNIKYTNNYELGTSKICKIPELCILFVIYYNEVYKVNNYNIFFIEDKTLKTMLNFAMMKYQEIMK